MKATQILMNEHRVIERVLNSLDAAVARARQDDTVRPGFFIDAADFIRGFADGCHHRKEEGVLFKTMGANGMPVEGGPIGVMLYEHEQGRAFTRGMRSAAERWQAGDMSAKLETLQNASRYTALLRQHIQKEDAILFPMADRVIPQAEYAQVEQGFEHVEHEETGEGIHEKYLGLAEKLEREIGNQVASSAIAAI
jgi:hemerythrin-like domain-containing protein